MGIVFRQSVKNSLVISLGAVLGALTIWLSAKYIVDKQLFGFRNYFTTQAVTISMFLLFGINNTLVVFIHRYANHENKRKLLITICFLLPLITTGIITVFYLLFRNWILHHYQPKDIPLMREYFYWLPVYALLFIYMILFEQYLGSQMKVAISAFMREVVIRVLSIMLLLLYVFSYPSSPLEKWLGGMFYVSFHTLVIGTVLIYFIPVLIFLYLSFKNGGFGFSFRWATLSKPEYKELLHFSWYHLLLTVSSILLNSMDILLLPFYDHKGLNSAGIYSVAIFLISFLQMPSKALIPGSFTVLAKAFADEDIPKAKDLFERSSINILIPTVFMAVLISCNLQNAVAVIKNGYNEIIPVFLILMLGRTFDIATGMNDQVLSITNYYKFNFYLSLSLVVILYVLIRILVPHYGINGAAWSTTIAILIFNTIKYFFVRKRLNMQPFSKGTVLILLAGGITFCAGYFLPYILNAVLDTFIRSVIISIVYLLLLVWLRPSKDLGTYLSSIKQNKRLF